MENADLELQKAIYNRLVADAGVSGIVGAGVYDHVPADANFPYVHLGEVQAITEHDLRLGDDGLPDLAYMVARTRLRRSKAPRWRCKIRTPPRAIGIGNMATCFP